MPRRKANNTKKTPYKRTETFTVSVNDSAALMDVVKKWRSDGKNVDVIDGAFTITARYEETGILEEPDRPEISHVGYTAEQCGREK